MLTFIDFFAGIGGFHSGFEKAGMKCIGWCEFNKYAQRSYRALYNTEGLWFANDVQKVRGDRIPKADIWTFGFPCQDVSIAGKQAGIKRGTRSGLFYEIMRLLDEAGGNRPQWLIAENVKNLLSIDDGWGFYQVLSEMAARGYSLEWRVYNSKAYGVPQSRERVYIAGYNGEHKGQPLLPTTRKSERTLKEIINGSQGDRVYNLDLACTISAQGGGLGAKTGLYCQFIDLSEREVKLTEYARCLTTGCNKGTSNHKGEISGVLLSNGVKCYIRKLTPKECWRLQGFTDEQFHKALLCNSTEQLYKQAGNAVTVNVVYDIGKHIVELEKGEIKT